MWAYTGENVFSSSSSKNFPGVISHMVLRGRVTRVQGFKKKTTTRVVEHNFKKFYVKCTELFSKIKKKFRIIEN
jgi:hypothetical protein